MVTASRISLSGDARRDIAALDTAILDALNALIQRAGKPTAPSISDEQTPEDAPEPRGVLMDCEFGLVLLSARAALTAEGHSGLAGELADDGRVQQLVLSLVSSTLHTIGARPLPAKFRGGCREDAPFFFAAEPYAYYRFRSVRFTANLDAAMIMVGFFAAALQQYDAMLAQAPAPESLRVHKVTSLRDAALLACREGLSYALQCRMPTEGGLACFTSDPLACADTSKGADAIAAEFELENRLFYTWTTAETVRELSATTEWAQYLASVTSEPARSIASATSKLTEELSTALAGASEWCFRTFNARLEAFEPPDMDVLVRRAKPYKTQDALPAELQRLCEDAYPRLMHVYHIAQYAAVRSIAPEQMTLDEVRHTAQLLERLVSQSVLASELDIADHPDIFKLLKREYRFWNAEARTAGNYPDDAYFPLVVRALSGLLTRTLTSLHDRAEGEQPVQALVSLFRGLLQRLVTDLLARRPAGDDLQALWSRNRGGPYLLYATQRTVLALLAYQEFIERVDEYEKTRQSPARTALPADELRQELLRFLGLHLSRSLFDKALMDFFQSKTLAGPSGSPGAADAMAQGTSPNGDDLLPRLPWARALLETWLRNFSAEFERQKVPGNLRQWVDKLQKVHEARAARRGQPRDGLERAWQAIVKVDGIGQLIEEQGRQDALDVERLHVILFDYLFRQSIERAIKKGPGWEQTPLDFFSADDVLWLHITTAIENLPYPDATKPASTR